MTIETTTSVPVPIYNGAIIYVPVPCTRDLTTGKVIIAPWQEREGKQRIEKAVLEYEKSNKWCQKK